MDEKHVKELLRKKGDYLYHREGQELEFKENFNFAGLADYYRDFAAFANNRGGYLIFGIKDSPRKPIGLKRNALKLFEKIDPQVITGHLLDIFSSNIKWQQNIVELYKKKFGVFYIYEADVKPIIAKKDEGKDQIIMNGEVYFRFGGRTQKIRFAELESIINKRIESNNNHWLDLMQKIGKAGPQNAAILDTEKGLFEKDETQVLVLDENLIDKMRFIKTGEFVEKKGEATLKLVDDVVPIDRVEVVKKVKQNLIKEYPLSATELIQDIKKKLPSIRQNKIYDAIKENDLKNNPDYSVYVFRNKRQEDEYKRTGIIPTAIPSIYRNSAIDFIIKVLQNQN